MRRSTVLVVDPNPLTSRRVAEAFARADFDVVSARDAVEAESSAEGRDIALVLAATSLPKGNGYDLARLVRERHPAASVFLMAGGFEVYNSTRASEAGVVGHIPKPLSADGLRARVEAVLGPVFGDAPEPAPAAADASRLPPAPAARPVAAVEYSAPISDERLATILPRDYVELTPVVVDPDVVAPAMERAILEVLPEVVEVVLRQALHASPAFRDLVEVAVDEAVRSQLPEIAERVVRERLAEIEARGVEDQDPS